MTPRQRVLTAFSRRIPDRVPYGIEFNREALKVFKEKTGSEDPCEYFGVDFRVTGLEQTKVDLKERFSRFHSDLPPNATLNEWGTAFIPGSMPAFDHFIAPLTSVSSIKEIEDYPLPDFQERYRYQHLEEDVKRIKEKEFAVIGGTANSTIFEVAWQIRGFNELLFDFMMNREYAEVLLDRITALRCYQVKREAEAGVDIIYLGDDVGMQDRLILSPDIWRRWLKMRLGKVIESARRVNTNILISYDSDGYIEPIIPDLIEIGVSILKPVQPECMDPVRVKKMFGDRLAFWGTIGTQTTMPFGTPDEIKRTVKRMIETVGKGGGLLVAPTHVIEPEVPWENIIAFIESVKEFGDYRNSGGKY